MSTFSILEALTEEVGTRRAGSDGEVAAQNWLKQRCETLGLTVEFDEFTFVGPEWYRPFMRLITAIVYLAVAAFFLTGQTTVGIVVFAALFVYMNYVQKHLEDRFSQTTSNNVMAGLNRPISEYVADPDKGPAFLVCAHYDTPRNFPTWFRHVRKLFSWLAPIGFLGLLLYFVFLALFVVGWILAEGFGWDVMYQILDSVHYLVGTFTLILTAPLLLIMLLISLSGLFGRKVDSPGVDDNGSGTATILALAERLKANPPENIDVFFAWWGAEERGLFGSRQFVRRFHSQLDPDQLHVLNADCVGVGECMTVHTGQGLLKRRPTDPDMVTRLEAIAAENGVQTLRTWETPLSGGSSDHAPWINRGYTNAVTLLRGNPKKKTPPSRLISFLLRIPENNLIELDHIHSAEDTLDGINPKRLEQSTSIAEDYIRVVDSALIA